MHNIQACLITYSTFDMILRLLTSMSLGFAIGFEREYTSKWAGIKTHMLVALGSTVFTILSIYSFPKMAVTGSNVCVGDPARVAAQILTGIGFIGGGTVLRHGVSVYGLTTAASLWVAAAIGMAAGTGDFALAIFTTFISIIVLVAFRKFQYMFIRPNIKSHLTIKANIVVREDYAQDVIEEIINNFDNILELKKAKYHKEDGYIRILTRLDILDKDPIKTAYRTFDKINFVESIAIEQDFHEQ